MPGPMPSPPAQGALSGLVAAANERQKVMKDVMGGGVPNPTTPIASMPDGMSMPPQERQQFAHDTGIQANPAAHDISLPVPFEDLMRRVNAIMGSK